MSEETGRKHIDPNVKGDMAEHYAITFLWDQGYHVFRNCGSTGPIDLIAVDPNGEVKLIDVKSYKDGRLSSRTETQKRLGVEYLHYNSKTRKLRFINHRQPKVEQFELF